jgi:hypothetical protein
LNNKHRLKRGLRTSWGLAACSHQGDKKGLIKGIKKWRGNRGWEETSEVEGEQEKVRS